MDGILELALGESSGALNSDGLGALRKHSCQMAAQCRRRLVIYSFRLNPEIYNQPCFVEAVRQLIIRHARTRIQILVAETDELGRGGSGLVQLAQDLASSVEIRRRAEEFRGSQRSFMLADDCGYILRNLWSDLGNVRLDYNAPYVVRGLMDDFLLEWEQSEADPSLRRLSI
ncbi:DUF7931 domain-containing protein [Thiolapillus sp.]